MVGLLDLVLGCFARRDYRIGPVPAHGPLLVAPNHVSAIDPIAVAMSLRRAGRTPRFVITAGVMAHPVLGPVLRYFDHITLDRGRPTDPRLLLPVRAALARGECVVLYPEGAITQDERYRPARALPGLGRLASDTGAPVLPVAQWGAQHVIGRGRLAWQHWPPRRATIRVRAAPLRYADPWLGALDARRFVNAVMATLGAEVELLASELPGRERAVSDRWPARPARPARRRRPWGG